MTPLIFSWVGRLDALKKDRTMPRFRYELASGLKFWYRCALCKKEFGPERHGEVYKSPREILLNTAKKYLAVCPKCAKWVCTDCWSSSAKLCKVCLR